MRIRNRQKIVVLGMMGRMPVAGAVWQAMHYLIGFERLGYEAHYVEAHGCVSWAFGEDESAIASFIDGVMKRFGMPDRWAFHARTGSGSYYGKSQQQVSALYDSAAAIINLHGGTVPTSEMAATKRLVYIDTDPVAVQIELHNQVQSTLDFLGQHCALFSFGENYHNPDCGLPSSDRFPFKPTRQPVVLDFWNAPGSQGRKFTTIGNWLQLRRVVEYDGVEYYWSKHLEFLKFLTLPGQSTEMFELALSGCDDSAQAMLKDNGWQFRDAFSFSRDLDAYRDYIRESKGEFTVAKEQNIHFRTGWFSDRSATYLAAGKPVITQETGFRNVLPTGEGLFGFSTIDEILAAIDAINSNYERHSRAAIAISQDYFSHDVVLTKLLSDLGIEPGRVITAKAAVTPSASLPLVNVIGYPQGATGIGTLIQRYIRTLEYIGCPFRILDISSAERTPRLDGQVNLVCCDIDSYFSLRGRFGEELFLDRYNIGLWSWELPSFPEKWNDRFAYFDEVWTPTAFIASAVAPVAPLPVITLPPQLTTALHGDRNAGRQRLGVADGEYVFTFIFNFHSRVQRKNPLAAIDAFSAAFSGGEPARLVIKCVNADFDSDHFRLMQQRAEGRRISFHDGHWSAQEMSDLMEASDCYVSLHRAEGLALTITDAMASAKPVIATGWSGNMEFMNVRNSFPVRYEPVRLQEDVVHYQKGEVWAEPSISHAATLMREVFSCQAEARERGRAAQDDLARSHSIEVAGKAIAARLEIVSRRNQFRLLRHAVSQPAADVRITDEFSDLGSYLPKRYIQHARLKNELQRIVGASIPRNAVLMVVAKGDDDLLNLYECEAWHFPAGENHRYAGYHPRDSAEAISHLDSLRAAGGNFLLFPQPSLWWLDHYREFREHLEARYSVIHRDHACHIFDVSNDRQGQPA
jgi:glycosyltransferase involved in cell wall biosynthesis